MRTRFRKIIDRLRTRWANYPAKPRSLRWLLTYDAVVAFILWIAVTRWGLHWGWALIIFNSCLPSTFEETYKRLRDRRHPERNQLENHNL